MKKGLLTLLAASLVFVGCQNYDDQFDDLNAQISALKSQVDGLSSLSGQVSSLSGTISGLQAGVNAAQSAASAANAAASSIDLTGLSASLATLQAEVDAVQASLATAATAAAVTSLQAEVAAIQADVDDLLATSNVYTQNLTITSSSQLDAAVALGNNINIVNGTVTITQSSTMDATKLQSVINKIFTVTGNYVYTAANTNVTPMTFDQLASTGDLTLKVNGPISAKGLVTAGTLTLDDSYISKVTSINLDALTTVTEIQTDSGGTDNIVFTSATNVDLGSLAVYPGAGSDYGLTITTKKGATLDIGSLDDVKSDGTAADVALTLSGPKDVSISNMSAWGGSISATDIENLTLSGFKGVITINSGVENINITDAEQFVLSSATGLKTVTLDVDKVSDPDATATVKAPGAYGGAVTGYTGETPALEFSSMTNLTSVTLTGFYRDLTFTGLPNLTTVDIDATFEDIKVYNNDGLTSVDVTGSSFRNVWVEGNDAMTSLELDHTTGLAYAGSATASTYATFKVTDNDELTSLTSSADKFMTFDLTSNAKLATVNFTGLASTGATSGVVVDVYSNALTASQASDTDDGLTQYSIDGENDASDLGSYTTTSGMETLKTYITAVQAVAAADAAVHFDTVSLHNIASDGAATGETAGDQNSGNALTYATNGGEKTNWVGAVYYNTASTLSSSNPTQRDAQDEKRAWIMDVSAVGTSTITLKIDSTPVLANSAGTYGDVAIANSGNLDLIISQLKSSAAVSRAADLGATLNVYKSANSTMPAITFRASSTSASNGEGYTDAGITALSGGNGTLTSIVTTHDLFTLTIGGNAVTASITLSAGTSATGAAATSAVAKALSEAWNTKYGTGGASQTMSFWAAITNVAASATIASFGLKDANSGSRAYGDTISVSHSRASATTVSTVTSGALTQTFIDWTIGSDDAQLAATDNKATAVDLIISLEETTEDAIAGSAATIIYGGTNTGYLTELTTSKTAVGALSTTLATDIFENDAGIYNGVGDVRADEAADEGLSVSTGTARATRSRIHWLG